MVLEQIHELSNSISKNPNDLFCSSLPFLASVLEQIQVSNLDTKTQMIFLGLLILALFHGFVNMPCEFFNWEENHWIHQSIDQ